MRLTLLSSTHTPEYEYGVLYRPADVPVCSSCNGTLCGDVQHIRSSHRECVDYLATFTHIVKDCTIVRRAIGETEWQIDWADD